MEFASNIMQLAEISPSITSVSKNILGLLPFHQLILNRITIRNSSRYTESMSTVRAPDEERLEGWCGLEKLLYLGVPSLISI
jgi:hypothetical protein